MGEAKDKRDRMTPNEIKAEALTRKLMDAGLLMEAGWVSLRASVIPPDAPEIQVREMRTAFFAGAQHLFGSLTNVMDEGEEPTDGDMKRMENISAELEAFAEELKARIDRQRQ